MRRRGAYVGDGVRDSDGDSALSLLCRAAGAAAGACLVGSDGNVCARIMVEEDAVGPPAVTEASARRAAWAACSR